LNTKPCLVCCGILREEIETMIREGSLIAEAYFLDAGLHADFNELKEGLTKAINETSAGGTRPVVVIYGDYCHPQIKDLVSCNKNVVKIDAANCIDCLMGGHGKLLELDPKHEYFYLSPGWMPSKLRGNKRFGGIFQRDEEATKRQFRKLKGILVFEPFCETAEFRQDLAEFSRITGLPVLEVRKVGVESFRKLILEAFAKLEDQKGI
jgi:hypothetical protein